MRSSIGPQKGMAGDLLEEAKPLGPDFFEDPRSALLELIKETQRFLTQDRIELPIPLVERGEPPPPLPTPHLPTEKLEIERVAILKLEPAPPPPLDTFDDVRKRIKATFATLQILDEVPDDQEAHLIGEQWRRRSSVPEILLLAHEETVQARALLANLAKAIALSIGRCDLISVQQIERSNRWDHYLDPAKVKLIIAPDHAVYGVQPAMDRYREEASTSKRFLSGIPLLLLSDLPRYFHDPKRKAALWQAIRRAYG
jgi:hypothetical protein